MKKTKEITDLEQIKALLEQLPEDKKPIGCNLYEKLAFMHDTLTELQAVVRTSGAVEMFRQGENEYLRESPALKSYSTLIQRYCIVVKHIMDLFPKQAAANQNDDLYAFISEQ